MVVALSAFVLSHPAQAAPYAAIVMDARSGKVLYERNADTRLHPASLTKMMTLYVVFQEIEAGRLSLDDRITVSKYAASQPPSRLGLKAGQKIAVRYLIRAAAVKSANDAAAALGDHISGNHEAFAKRMTKTARAIGMKNTTFKNAHGLTQEGHLSSARDMNLLGRHLFYDFPQYYNIFSRRSADAGIAKVNNTNTRFLDAYEGADGIKTGYTVAAGFNLTASAQRGKKRIIATVFGGTSTAQRNAKMRELMDIGFDAAPNNARERRPDAAPVPEEALIAQAPAEIDVPDAEGGAGKTIRVSGGVLSSPRPKIRPAAAAPVMVAEAAPEEIVPDAVALAIAASVEDALGEAMAEPPPAGTLDAQAFAMENGATEAAAVEEPALAVAASEAPPPPPASLEAQALALAALDANLAPVIEAPQIGESAAEGTLDAQAVALAAADPAGETAPELATDPTLAGLRPAARPESLAPDAPPAAEVQLAEAQLAEELPFELVTEPVAPPVAETVELAAADPAIEPRIETMIEAPAMETPRIEAVQTVAAVTSAPEVALAAEAAKPTRNAPIFESAPAEEVALAAAEVPEEELVVISKSTSGGRHFGVNIGKYNSRPQAERELLKLALVESATLNDGLRKISQSGNAYHANFMGLTSDQANLACRRMKARGVPCETIGG
ncbi:serine hydrolase [Xinfangfangia sp. CPCC 101601]|uniref:Serine hydrolase n=2 Tax=Pseudogemmobacter lacusdianii TaxID=3069608 RepID=A0ABU0VW16_9RHOB|nr:serine hydrolase [Xinfangfangia sp. CPCC 101601]MDQ2065946.1 serine hydrolase [Xinfangfangia sp. CPCC 101601]